ncbi:probable 4-coumarate--CoA ligase 5 [Galendromus occidentalis]|uniref:Probable 4-coumarate--CoA ligase 5 n=1 Tax=Galendromus occidentalis TaxID=34638 RepID=A0AAJ6QWL0_9ACAR|nr:probable 4-coumarate--CoA ligase 5 [Galendromus occidentalis]
MVLKSDFDDIVIPSEPLHEYFGRLWSRHPERTALVDNLTGERLKYADFLAYVKKISGCLQGGGVKAQMKVQYFLKDSIVAFCTMQALKFANASIVLCRPHEKMTTREYVYQVRDSGVEYILCDPETVTLVSDTFKEYSDVARTKVIFFGNRELLEPYADSLNVVLFDDLLETDTTWTPPECKSAAEDIAIITYTSGTTGKPKGAKHPVKSLTGQSEMIIRGPKTFQDGDVYLLATSLFYAFEVSFSEITLNVGGTVVLARTDVKINFPEIVERNRITVAIILEVSGRAIMATAPQFPRYRDQMKSLRLMMFCGSVLQPKFAKLMSDFFSPCLFSNNYGMTENFAVSFTGNSRDMECSAGRPLPNVSIKIVDMNSREELPDGSVGELMLKSDSLMVGYLNETAESRNIEADGWLRTGDLAYIGADDRSIHLVDRCKQIIICMDDTLSPGELEEILREHEAVEQAVVIGVPHDELGEAPTAFVTVRPGFLADAALSAELRERVRKLTSIYKHLYGGVYFCSWDQVPKTGNGKISRLSLRDNFLKGKVVCTKPE